MNIDKQNLHNNNISPWVNEKKFIVLHHTAVVWDWNIKILWWISPSKVSCHYLIRQNGDILQFVDEDKIARHCGKSERQGHTNMNAYSVGIEIESDGVTFTDEQKVSLILLVNDIKKRNGLTYERVIRHKDISPWRKIDVWDNLWNKEFATYESFQKSFDQDSWVTAPFKSNLIKTYMQMWENIKMISSSIKTKDRIDELNDYFESVGF